MEEPIPYLYSARKYQLNPRAWPHRAIGEKGDEWATKSHTCHIWESPQLWRVLRNCPIQQTEDSKDRLKWFKAVSSMSLNSGGKKPTYIAYQNKELLCFVPSYVTSTLLYSKPTFWGWILIAISGSPSGSCIISSLPIQRICKLYFYQDLGCLINAAQIFNWFILLKGQLELTKLWRFICLNAEISNLYHCH